MLSFLCSNPLRRIVLDYEGVSLTSRDANSKAAASEASNIFASHYPELLVSCCKLYLRTHYANLISLARLVQEILCQRADSAQLDFLDVQTHYFC